jgi:phage gp36-like protein
MAYAAPADIVASWPKVHTAGLDHDELRTMIARADALIDAYCGQRYGVPFATDPASTPALVKMLSVDLAMLDVFNRMERMPDWIRDRITRAYELLQKISEGLIVVPGVGENLDAGVIRSTTSGYQPIFGAVPSLGETFDPDRADDEGDARD